MKDIIAVKNFLTRNDANVAKSVLDANKIKSYIQADDVGGLYSFSLSPIGIRLLINKKDLKKAKILLNK